LPDRFSVALKLIAFDSDDLAVVSAHLQDARLTLRDIAWLPTEKRLVLAAQQIAAPNAVLGLRFDRVTRVERLNLPGERPDLPLTIVGALFEPAEPPGGRVVLLFAEGRSVRLTVECIEAVLGELGGEEALAPAKMGP
jgi:hypothetical protein